MNRSGEISSWLLDQIAGSGFRVGEKIPSEYELADRFKVNKTTANKAVAELVTKGYLRRCRGAAGTIVIKNIVFPRGGIGFYLSLGNVSYYTKLFSGAQMGAFSRGYTMQFFDNNASYEHRYFLECLRGSGIGGLLVSHMNWVPEDLPFPIIYINDLPGTEKCNWVNHDNFDGGCQIGRHLVRLGHRRTVFIRQNNVAKPLRDRYEGFCLALREAGVPTPPAYVFDGNLSRVELMWERIHNDHPGLTAIACDGDNVALQFCHYLKEIGLRVPEDISVSGFSFLPEVQRMIKITTMDEKPQELGYHAAGLLIDLVEDKRRPLINEKIPLELKIGATTCPPPQERR